MLFKNLWEKTKENLELFWFLKEENCLLCGSHQGPICTACQSAYFLPDAARCFSCGKLVAADKEQCRDCRDGKGPKGLTKTTALGHYTGAWKEFIQKVKFKGQPYLLASVTEYITAWAVKNLPPPDGVVPVPMHFSRLRERGFNQAEALASLLSRHLGIEYMPVLVRIRDTVPQAALNRKERLQNLQGAFQVQTGIKLEGKSLWLVDDVTTTGATLGECAGELLGKGAVNVYAICLAAGKEE